MPTAQNGGGFSAAVIWEIAVEKKPPFLISIAWNTVLNWNQMIQWNQEKNQESMSGWAWTSGRKNWWTLWMKNLIDHSHFYLQNFFFTSEFKSHFPNCSFTYSLCWLPNTFIGNSTIIFAWADFIFLPLCLFLSDHVWQMGYCVAQKLFIPCLAREDGIPIHFLITTS